MDSAIAADHTPLDGSTCAALLEQLRCAVDDVGLDAAVNAITNLLYVKPKDQPQCWYARSAGGILVWATLSKGGLWHRGAKCASPHTCTHRHVCVNMLICR